VLGRGDSLALLWEAELYSRNLTSR
jgi:hypothetical protein